MKNEIKIHPCKGTNRWCGPGALAILTGVSTDDASRMIRCITGKRSATSTHTHVLRKVLGKCGIDTHRVMETFAPTNERMTLNQWVKGGGAKGGTFLVIAGNHFQIVTNDLFVDNQVKTLTAFEDLTKGKRRRVEEVFRLSSPQGVKIPTHINRKTFSAVVIARARNKGASIRRRAQALAKKLTVDIDTTDWRSLEQLWISVGDEFEAKYGDPWESGDGHCRFDWDEVLGSLEEEQERRLTLPSPRPAKRFGKTVGERRNEHGDMEPIIRWKWRQVDEAGHPI